MLSPRWKKILSDLWFNKARSALVVMSIAVGIFAVGVVQHIRTVVIGEMQVAYEASDAGHARINASNITDDLITTIRNMPRVLGAEGRSSLSVSVEIEPGRWEPMNVSAVADFEELSVNKLKLIYEVEDRINRNAAATTWPKKDEIVLERSSLGARDALPPGLAVGDLLTVETAEGKQRTLRLAGLVYDANNAPATFRGSASGFVDFDTFERLGGARTYSEISLRVEGSTEQIRDVPYVKEIAEDVARKIEKSGRDVRRVRVFRPGRIPLEDLFLAITLVLTPLGVLALILGSFLVVNIMSALMSQQTRQIGVMKAIGANRGQIILMYFGAVGIYSILSLLVAIPLTVVVASLLEGVLGRFVNLTMPGIVLPTNVLVIQVIIGLVIPLVAALFPILKGTAVTVREAISDYGVGKGQYGSHWLDRIVSRIRGLRRTTQISLRNTFRRRARLILTLITLVLGGMIFMTVGSVRSSLEQRVEEVLAYNQFDIRVQFERQYRTVEIERAARSVEGVIATESWSAGQAIRIRDDGSESDTINITALPADSQMVNPTLVSGRWLVSEDENAVVLSQSITADEPDIQLGDTIRLEIDDKERLWSVVGFAQTTEFGGSITAYVNYPYFAQATGNLGRAANVLLQIQRRDDRPITEMVETFEATFEEAGLKVASTFTVDRIRSFTGNFFTIIISLLLAMGVIIASVGALGLAGTMSTNVLERTREIGVLRAIGASNGAVLRIVLIEGMLIGMLSWMVGAMLAFPAGFALSNAIGLALFQAPLTYVFSSNGVFMWLGIVVVLAALSSFLPARGASRLTVREVLAYE